MMHGVRGFFRFAHIDGSIPADPAVYVRLPKIHADETRTQGLDRLELIRFLQVAQAITVHHGALAYLLGINALRASEAAAVRIEDYADTLRGHRVLHLIGKGSKPATMPLTVPVLRVLEACRGDRTEGPLVLRPLTGKAIDRRDVYRMVRRIAKAAGIPRHVSPHSLRHAAITNALDASVPLRDAQILARHGDPRTSRALRPRPRQPRPTRRPLPHRLRRRRLSAPPLQGVGAASDPPIMTRPVTRICRGAVSPRLAYWVAQVRHADAWDHRRVAKDGWRAGEVVEESDSGAKKYRREVDVDFVEEASVQALLDGVRAVDPDVLPGAAAWLGSRRCRCRRSRSGQSSWVAASRRGCDE